MSAQRLLVIIGATAEGKKELVGLADGIRESAQSWKELLLDLKRRGLTLGPQLAVADGALGFLESDRSSEMAEDTDAQRCLGAQAIKTSWVRQRRQRACKQRPSVQCRDIWMAETRKDAEAAFDGFIECYGLKYEKALWSAQRRSRPIVRPSTTFRGRALEAFTNDESDREHVRNCAASNVRIKGLLLEQDQNRHDLQARASSPRRVGVVCAATTSCRKSFAV